MRIFARCSLVVLLASLLAGPVFAAPVAMPHAPTLAAPGLPSPAPLVPWLEVLGGVAAFGAIRIKDTGSISKKFVQRAGVAGGDYTEGVKAAGQDWEANTKAAEDNYAQGVQSAIADKRFGRGVSAAGAGKYVTKASTLGAQRYPTGVAAAEGAYATGVQPFLQMMAGLTLPPRRPKGDPANAARSQAVAQANRALKVGR